MYKSGAELIAEERQRQIDVEGWTSEHDHEHEDQSLASAAASYALTAAGWPRRTVLDELWPWDEEWFKTSPDNPIRDLIKAGALIAAEIDRLQSAQSNIKADKSSLVG